MGVVHDNRISPVIKNRFKEIFAFIVVVFGLLVLQSGLWVSSRLSVTHDSIIWFGLFSYFVDCLHNGFLPLWNPYMNCGEPFFLNITMLHLWDPSTLLLVITGKLLHADFLALYHYDILLRYIIFIGGSYLFFRHVAKYKISAFISFITISFSSLCTSYLRQHAFILAFYLLPWILLCIFKLLEQKDPKFILALAFFLGIALPSQHAVFVITSVSILLIPLLFSKGASLKGCGAIFKDHKAVIGSIFIFFLLAINLLPLYLEYKHNIVPTVRLFEAPGSAFSTYADFYNLLAPYSFVSHFFNWHYTSEAFLYIGLVPLFFSIIGVLFSRHKYKFAFALSAVTTALLMLGDYTFVYGLFNRYFPLFSVIRNMHTFCTFFIFCLVYFTCIGADTVFEWAETSRIGLHKKHIILAALLICFAALLVNRHILNIFHLLIGRYHIFNGELQPVTEDLAVSFKDFLYNSFNNVFLFAVYITITFILLLMPKINKKIMYSAVILFILSDLLMFNHLATKFLTMPRINPPVRTSSKPVYSDFRSPVIQPYYPYYAFIPAMKKEFTAYSTKIPWVTTHFFELKDYYEFFSNERISDGVKKELMGISAPKLRLAEGVKVLSHRGVIEELAGMEDKDAFKNVLVEESLPFDNLHSETTGNGKNNGPLGRGNIRVINFNPNEINIDVYSDRNNLLYYSDAFDKNWRVFINGKEGKVYKADLAFKSAVVGRGKNAVRFIYDPKLYKITLLCYFSGLLVSLLVFSRYAFRSCGLKGKTVR